MGKNQSLSNLTNIVLYDTNGNLSFVSGSTTLLSVSSSGALTTNSTITARTLVVQTVSSSISYSSGSNVFGNLSSNTQVFTGSMYVTGAFYVPSGSVGLGTNSPNTKLHVAADGAYVSNWDAAQFWVTGTDTAKRLQLGYDTTNGYGIIQAIHGGVSVKNLLLNPQGGNVGIGTTSPSDIIDIQKNQNAITNFYFRNTNTTDTNSRAYINLISGTVSLLIKAIHGDHTYLTPSAGSDLYLGYNNSVRILSGGDLQINSATTNKATFSMSNSNGPELQLDGVAGSSSVGGSARLRIGSNVTNSRAFWLFQLDASNYLGTFYFNDSVGTWSKLGYQTTGGTWTNSDERRKENIELSNYGLNEVMQLIPKKFNFKIDEKKVKNLGFIAQDVLPIIPEAVQTDLDHEEEYYAMNYANLVPVLVKAIQELKAEIDELKNNK